LSRDTLPLGADFAHCFRWGSGRASFASGNVCCLHCRWRVHQRGGTKHFLRCSRRGDHECRDRSGWSLRPRNLSVPSSRPRQRGGCTGAVRPGVSGAGEGQPAAPRHDSRPEPGAGAAVQSQAKGSGHKGLCAPTRLRTQRHPPCRARHAGCARACPVRRAAPPLRSLSR
jgi:hypothetical protein